TQDRRSFHPVPRRLGARVADRDGWQRVDATRHEDGADIHGADVYGHSGVGRGGSAPSDHHEGDGCRHHPPPDAEVPAVAQNVTVKVIMVEKVRLAPELPTPGMTSWWCKHCWLVADT